MPKVLTEASVFASLLKKSERMFRRIEQWLDATYIHSQLSKIINKIKDGIKFCFRYSFLGKITEVVRKNNLAIMQNSKVIGGMINLYRKFKDKIINYSKTSGTSVLIGEFEERFYLLPVKTAGIVIFAAIITNIFFCAVLKKEIGLWGWIMRGLFLFVGFGALFCNATWQDIKRGE